MLKIRIGYSLNCPVIDLVSLNCKIKSDLNLKVFEALTASQSRCAFTANSPYMGS